MSTDEPQLPVPVPEISAPEVYPDLQHQIDDHWGLATTEARLAMQQTLTVAFLGSASSGKDSAIRALFGLDFGQVDPIPGSTEFARVAPVDPDRQLLVINAPGFGDLRANVQHEAERVLDELDLAVYVVNCDGGATIDERRDLDRIRELGRPTLVCLNKIDLIRPAQREAFVRATMVQLGVHEDMVIVTAFDPMPALSPEPIGLTDVIGWIHHHLEEGGKSLLFAKNIRNKAAACEPVIIAAARKAAMAGAIPVPGADATAVMAVQVSLITELAAIFDRQLDKEVVLFVIGQALAGTSKGFVRWAVKAVKAAGFIPGGQVVTMATSALGATVAGATTYGVGKAAVLFLEKEGKVSGADLRDVFDAEAFSYRHAVSPDPT